MQTPLIFNSTPLIYLTKVSLAKLLKEIPEKKFTTTKVFNEVVQEGKKKGAPEASLLESLFKEETIKVRNPNDKEYLKSVKKCLQKVKDNHYTKQKPRFSAWQKS